jgi:hypothetical protein
MQRQALRRRHRPSSAVECEELVQKMYSSVKRSTHGANQWESNTGEVLPESVTFLLTIVGPIGPSDVFLDVGSGLGNIVCQVLLQTDAQKAIGMEKQRAVLELGESTVNKWQHTHRVLKNAEFHEGDVRAYVDELPEYALDTTIVYSNNVRFRADANHALFQLASSLPKVRLLITAVETCPRHRARCQNRLCATWKCTDIIQTAVSWTASPVLFYVYKRVDLLGSVLNM